MLRLSLCLLALSCALGLNLAEATEPASATLSPQSGTLTITGGPYLVSNPSATAGDAICDGDGLLCDQLQLTVDISSAYRSANPNAFVEFVLTWEDPAGAGADDLDLYIRNASDDALLGAAASASPSEIAIVSVSALPAEVRVDIVPFAVTGSSATLTISLMPGAASEGGGEPDPCRANGASNEGEAALDPEVRTALDQLPQGASFGALVHFNMGTIKQQNALLAQLGLSLGPDFRRYARSVYVTGPIAAFRTLVREPSVAYIEYNRPLHYLGDTGPWASRVRVAQEPVSGGPYFDAQGNRLTGKGVTLGIIDSGLFGPHPDFAGRILHNYKLVDLFSFSGSPYVDLGETGDTESQVGGHGTHVTGTVAGGGQASDGGYPDPTVAPLVTGTYAGVAPEANIIHWGHGAGLFVLSALTAYQHIIDQVKADAFDPPLRAVNNSYGDDPGTPYNPSSTTACLVKEIIRNNVVMVFAASNDGGDGSTDMTSSTCKDPTPGVICVASYNDLGTGDRNAPLSSFSSRGRKGVPAEYPDIAAPGDLITSTCAQGLPSQAICTGGDDNVAETDWQPWYGTISGTSMATPHVVGAIGLIAQARPELTPAQIEALIQRTARKVGDGYEPDPQLPGSTIHFGYGAGLLDLPSALDALMVPKQGLPVQGTEYTVLDADLDSSIAGAADVTRLTVQEMSLNGQPGLMYRLSLRDAADFGDASEILYRVERNVAGVAVTTGIQATAQGVSIPEAGNGNNAVAMSAFREGNVVAFFVPSSQTGFPTTGEPVHNVRVQVMDNTSGLVDLAPSPADSQIELAALQPMFGRPFTLQLDPGVPPENTERACELPGLTALTSPAGTTGLIALPGAQDDLQRLWVGESDAFSDQLVFTLKVDNLSSVPPAHRWYVYFKVAGDDNEYFVAMDSTEGPVRYVYGTRSVLEIPMLPVGRFTTLGEINAASNHTPDGTITLVLDKSTLGIKTGDVISGIAASIRQSTPGTTGASGLTVDSAASLMDYTVIGNGPCQAAALPSTGAVNPALLIGLLLVGLLGSALRRRTARRP
ncbi:MAG: S8 family serine peptidase [Gammaproteobacteria bacterium]